MKIRLGLILLALLVLVGGCTFKRHEVRPESREAITITETHDLEDAPYGIRMGKTYITSFYPGAVVDTLTASDEREGLFKKGDPSGVIIVNNLAEPRQYMLVPIQAIDPGDGYSEVPEYVLTDWVMISDPAPVLQANETRLIPISLWMPPDAEVFADKWAFGIWVKDIDQSGFAQTAYSATWFVEME